MAEKILVVDDELETLRLVGLMLQKRGYQIVAANNGAQALNIAKTENPNLILLDVMMPDMDGYEVTRQLRSNPVTADIPILMFTAKSQVDDKISGYDSGVDDYLTKPTHPDELAAHVRALLSRRAKIQTGFLTPERGQIVGVLAVKGGIGTSSLVINVGISLYKRTKGSIIAVELHPGQGNWGVELGLTKPEGLNRLLAMKPGEITPEVVKLELIPDRSGLQLLTSSYQIKDVAQIQALTQLETVINHLATLGQIILLDIGNNLFVGIDRVLALCNEVIVVVEPHPTTVARSKVFIEELRERGFGKSKLLTTVLVNRIRSDVQLSWTQVQDSLEQPVSQVISPVPELAFQAAVRYTPITMIQPDGLIAQQYSNVADLIAQRIRQK
jgi:CheY-like chemotaxis protein